MTASEIDFDHFDLDHFDRVFGGCGRCLFLIKVDYHMRSIVFAVCVMII